MDQQRLEELVRKRDESGLTKEEADELGKLLAAKAGEPYSNAEALRDGEGETPAAWQNPKLEEEGAREIDRQGPSSQEPDKRDASELGAGAQKGSVPGPGPRPAEVTEPTDSEPE